MSNMFARRAVTDARLLQRSVETLLGITAGILSDGVLSDQEILYLDTWLKDHDHLAYTFPGEVVVAAVRETLKDGKIIEREREHLKQVLEKLLGGTLEQTGVTSGLSSKLPLDAVASITIDSRAFCFTGEFMFGTREKCQRAVLERGGIVSKGVRKDLNYLVIGMLASREWAHTSFGRKIEKAMEYKSTGCEILIVAEDQWVNSL